MQGRAEPRLRLRPAGLYQEQTYFRHLGRNLLHDLLPPLDQRFRHGSDRRSICLIASQQGALYRHGRKILRGDGGIPHVCAYRNQSSLKRRVFDLHCGRVLNGQEP